MKPYATLIAASLLGMATGSQAAIVVAGGNGMAAADPDCATEHQHKRMVYHFAQQLFHTFVTGRGEFACGITQQGRVRDSRRTGPVFFCA